MPIKFEQDSKNRKAFLYIERLSNKTDAGLRRGLDKTGRFLRKDLMNNIKKGRRTGIKYPKARRRSSVAGEYPANQKGNLRRKTGFKIKDVRTLEFGNRAKYAKHLELGTKKMKPRLLIDETVKTNLNKIYNELRNNLVSELD